MLIAGFYQFRLSTKIKFFFLSHDFFSNWVSQNFYTMRINLTGGWGRRVNPGLSSRL
jgi:hypothetical protein